MQMARTQKDDTKFHKLVNCSSIGGKCRMAPFLHHQIILRKLECWQWVWFEVELGSPKTADEQVDLGVLGREQLRRKPKFTLASTHMHICTHMSKK